jgi:hypothetical protein
MCVADERPLAKGVAMSNPADANLTPAGQFQALFGAPPSGQDASADCKKWEQLYAESLEERKRLLAELERLREQCEGYRRVVSHLLPPQPCPYSDEELLALAQTECIPSLSDLIEELSRK